MSLMGLLDGRVPVAASGGGTLTYTATDVSQAWIDSNAPSFTGVNIGTVAADRVIVVSITVAGTVVTNSRPSSVTVGGVFMTNATGTSGETPSGGGAGNNTYVYYLLAPAGVLNASTATIVVTTTNAQGIGISVGNLNGSVTASVNAFNGCPWQGGGTIPDPRGVPNDLAAVAVASGGIVVICAQIDRSGSYIPSGGTTSVDANTNDPGGATHALVQGHGTSGSPAITPASNFNLNFAIASFAP